MEAKVLVGDVLDIPGDVLISTANLSHADDVGDGWLTGSICDPICDNFAETVRELNQENAFILIGGISH